MQIISPTKGPWEEHICGRPLGLRFAADGRLLVADAYLGIFAVNVETGEKELLVDPSKEIAGRVPRLIDDLDEDDEGNIYWSDASTISNLSDSLLEYLSDGTGRLIKYNPKTKSNTVLVKDVHFANGVQLAHSQDFVLFSETFKNRVLRFWLKGPKSGKVDVYVDKLPGSPDNIRPRAEGGYYVSLIVTKGEKLDLNPYLTRVSYFRKFLSRFLLIIKFCIDGITKLVPNSITPQVSYMFLHLEPVASTMGPSIVVEVDEAGTIIGSLQGKGEYISETARVGDNLFFGSPYNKYLGHLFIGEPELDVDGQYVRVVSRGKEVEEPVVREVEEEIKEKKEAVESAGAPVEAVEELGEGVDEEQVQFAEGVKEEDQPILEGIVPSVAEEVETIEEELVVAPEEGQVEVTEEQVEVGTVVEEKADAVEQVEIVEQEQTVVVEEGQVEVAEEQAETGTIEESKPTAKEDEVKVVEETSESVIADEAPIEEVTTESEQVEAAAEEQVEVAVEEQVEAAAEEQVEAAAEKQVEAAAEKQVEAAAEKQVEAAAEKQVEAAAEEQVKAAVEVAAEEQVEAAEKEPVEAVIGEQVEAPVEEQVEAAVEEPTEAVIGEQIEAPVEEQVEVVAEEPTKAGVEEEVEAAIEHHEKSPSEEVKKEETQAEDNVEGVKVTENEEKVVPEVEIHKKEEL
ncbi:uncharacterized protein LOC143033951 isoform X2 [Oratosquilla oratoria]|uniref:uncharacterized protein LOC143033951 isoform X2 n=1 Tax=Oratosquilla oratoria TaxID=337810 RepID=UPI003F77803C